MRQQHPGQQQQQAGGPHYNPQGSGQRMPQGGGGGIGGGVPSPHTAYHQRSSPPMRGPYPSGAGGARPHHPSQAPPRAMVGHPHAPRAAQGGGRFQVQHPPQGMPVGGPRPMPLNGSAHMMMHHAPSPGMPRRVQMPPSAMRPMSQQGGPGPHASYEQQQQQAHMMRLHHDHQQRQLQNSNSDEPGESGMQQQGHFQLPPATPDQRAYQQGAAQRESPSPPPVPPRLQQQQSGEGAPSPSPASQSDGDAKTTAEQQPQVAKTPASWTPGPGLGPLRESRLQNVHPQHRMVPMQQHPQAQRPHPQHPMSHRAFITENMQRFQTMQHHPSKQMGNTNMPQNQQQHKMARTMLSPAQQHVQAQALQEQQLQQQQQQNQKQGGKKGPGPDVTMDAASVLLALRTSASPGTVPEATLQEQRSKDQSDDNSKDVSMAKIESQDNHDMDDDDDVPALQSSSSSMSVPKSCPTNEEEEHHVPKDFPTRLALPNDEAKLNSLHCFLRSELLEIFVVERSQNKSPTHSPGSSVGRVGLRCVFCAMQRKRNQISPTDDTVSTPQQHRCDEAPMAVFYPKSIAEIYRLVTSWQRCHLRKCRNLPPDIRAKWQLLRENDKSRGKTHYWITSAKEIGLVDCQSRAGGIRFANPRTYNAADNESVKESQAREEDRNSAYAPYNIPFFKEGPSQKHREATEMDVTATASSNVETPLKDTSGAAKTITEADNSDEVPPADVSNSSQHAAVVGV